MLILHSHISYSNLTKNSHLKFDLFINFINFFFHFFRSAFLNIFFIIFSVHLCLSFYIRTFPRLNGILYSPLSLTSFVKSSLLSLSIASLLPSLSLLQYHPYYPYPHCTIITIIFIPICIVITITLSSPVP